MGELRRQLILSLAVVISNENKNWKSNVLKVNRSLNQEPTCASNIKVCSLIQHEIKLVQAFMSVLDTSDFDDDE